ncbi:Telomere end binding protein [Penicillium digitatum]|uniref:Telomeric single stranded DNA binding POT1/Cdc13 domain-containing protein n=3 Tax=Penicillium digitatum TaxID=36651 RepID=K9G7Y2_PEND2|nr:hypothetical protein PDIP_48980 [Penicillium digitatum Pd1]EKV10888.1 hypothetical protein PDIG_53760 [Penicillium digitatum PHI26]EKV13210.1 hypothetical protein PDIP_48980 [Penicillium digitatum Pd1]QQK43538.1 Telomere end binding protein [Penicillium digitatum]
MNAVEQSPEQSLAPNTLAHLTRVPIAQLSPDLEQLDEKSFLAAIALVWPYSSSTKSVSLLLAEPDFRLRGAKGQIKVTFHGHVAEKVAESHVGIGDTVCLALKGTKFVSNEAVQKTPGRSVAWDAHFENGVSLEICRSSQPPLTILVDHQVAAPHETELAPPATPNGKSNNPELGLAFSARPWGSPVFLKSTRTSFGGTIRSDFDPFAEEDGFVPGKGRKKPRYSLHREDWRIINESEPSHEEEAPMDWEQALNQSIDQELDEADLASEPSDDPTTDAAQAPTNTEDTSQEPPPLFLKPPLELTESILERHADESNVLSHEQVENHGTPFHLPTDTPQIRPILSPGLPIPSPLVSSHGGSASYFLPWTTLTQSKEIRSVPVEMSAIATPAASLIETQDTDAIEPIHKEIAEPAVPNIEAIRHEHAFDSGFVFLDDSASPPGSASLPKKQEFETIDSCRAILETDVVEADVTINFTSGEAQMSNEAARGHASDDNPPRDLSVPLSIPEGKSDDSFDFNEESAAAEASTGTENAVDEASKSFKTDDERIIDLWGDDSAPSSCSDESSDDESLGSSQEMDGSDIGQADLGIETASNNVGSPQYPGGSHEEHSEPESQSVNYPNPTSALNQDAIDALESLITARDEEFERKREETELGDEVGSSPSQGYSEEKEETLKDQEMHYAESVESYDSQDEYEEHGQFPCDPRLDQDDFSVAGSSGEKSEQGQNLPPQTENHEVIVLDSDSDDEHASNYPVASAFQPKEQEDHSHCLESGHPAVPPAAADFSTGILEYPEPWYVGGEDGYHRAVEDDSDVVQRQESEESEEREYNQQDGRVDESGMDDDESTRDHHETVHPSDVASPSPEQDEDEDMEDVELNEEADNNEYYATAELSADVEVSVNRDSDEGQSGNIDQNLLDVGESHHQGPPPEVESHAGRYLTGDAQSDLHIPSSARNIMAKFILRDTPTIEGPEPLGGRIAPSVRPPLGRQLLAPDPTQENASMREPIHDFESDSSFAIEEHEAPTGLDESLQPAGSQESDQDEIIRADLTKNARQELHVDEHDDSMASSELAEAVEPPTTPEPSRSLEVVISTKSPKAPAVPVSHHPVPDRNASRLRTKLCYFAPLATLIDRYDSSVDTISIVHEASPITRAKSGLKLWFVTIQLTDPSMAGTTLRAQIFRHSKASMPVLAEGNAILLRDFKVRNLDHTVMLTSVDSSAWAVFSSSGPDAETNGPPVEYDSQERAYASGLRRWYVEVGSDRVADHMLQAAIERDSEESGMTPSGQVPSESGSPDSKRGSQRKRKSNRRVTIHELRDGTRYTEVGPPTSRNSSVHELRDGTLYANI